MYGFSPHLFVSFQVRLWEEGWKDRYYHDKCKLEDIKGGGGRERLFQTYVEGLCWVMLYYYQGCPSWTWYYPFHYAPFASDLINCDRQERRHTNRFSPSIFVAEELGRVWFTPPRLPP